MTKFSGAAFAAGLALFTANCAQAQHAQPDVQSASVDAAAAEAQRADIAIFQEQFLGADRSYSASARAEAEARLAALSAQSGAVSAAYFELELSRIVALADNGHTILFPAARAAHFNRVPVRLAFMDGDFYVMRAEPGYADLLGAKLVAIDNADIETLRAAARTLLGGADNWRDRAAPFLLESPEQLHALGLAERADAAHYQFESPNGRSAVARMLPGAPSAPPEMSMGGLVGQNWFMPEIAADSASRMVLSAEDAPWSLREPGRAFRSRAAPELNAYVLQIRQVSDSGDEAIADAMARFEAELRAAAPQHVVLDMRGNHGGDLNTTRAFMQALPGLVPGRIFVLTDEGTFSAAISSIGYLRQAGGVRVTIVGAPVGDRLNFFAEGGLVRLPNAQSFLLVATERHDYQTGCEGYDDCHGAVVRNPIAVETLAPDIAAPWTMDAYSAGRDPAMEAVAAALR